MPKSIKLKNDTYLDTKGIVHNKLILSDLLNTLIPTVLYDNANGSTGNIVLDDNVNNYQYVEILCLQSSDNIYFSSGKLSKPFPKNIQLSTTFYAGQNSYVFSATKHIKDNQILDSGHSGLSNLLNNVGVTGESRDYIKIVKVLGYK